MKSVKTDYLPILMLAYPANKSVSVMHSLVECGNRKG
jgi:hypothetical protein